MTISLISPTKFSIWRENTNRYSQKIDPAGKEYKYIPTLESCLNLEIGYTQD
jgi:hypothetical protein